MECTIVERQYCNRRCATCGKNGKPDKATAAPVRVDSVVRVQYVLQVDLLQHNWDDVQISETLESAQGDVDYWKRKTNKPVRIVRRTDEVYAP